MIHDAGIILKEDKPRHYCKYRSGFNFQKVSQELERCENVLEKERKNREQKPEASGWIRIDENNKQVKDHEPVIEINFPVPADECTNGNEDDQRVLGACSKPGEVTTNGLEIIFQDGDVIEEVPFKPIG